MDFHDLLFQSSIVGTACYYKRVGQQLKFMNTLLEYSAPYKLAKLQR